MCQQFKAEQSFIQWMEENATIRGYEAAKRGEPQSANSEWCGYTKDAWNHGWECWREGIVPYCVERNENP